MAPSQAPKYLTGDANAINEFLDKFDVRHFLSFRGGCLVLGLNAC